MYVYCRNCGWQQDDFWDWNWTLKFWKYRAFGYNPLQLLIDEIREWIRPRYVTIQRENGDPEKIFSWKLLVKNCFDIIQRARNMKWKTFRQFQRDTNKTCPRCGSNRLAID